MQLIAVSASGSSGPELVGGGAGSGWYLLPGGQHPQGLGGRLLNVSPEGSLAT